MEVTSLKAPHWIAGYEVNGKIKGRKTKNSVRFGKVNFYVFTPDDVDENALKTVVGLAERGELEILNPEEVVPHIAAKLNSSLNLISLLNKIEKYICALIGAEAASILVHKGDHLVFLVTEGGASGKIESIPVPMNSIAGTIFLEERTLIFNDLSKEKRHFKGVDKAAEFTTKNIMGAPIWAGKNKIGVIEVLNKEEGFSEEDAKVLTLFAKLIGKKLFNTLENERFRNLIKEIVLSIASAIDKRDQYTHEHSRNVARISKLLGRKLNLSDKELEELEVAAILHDVGKIGIPDSILLKPGKLTKEEFEYIKNHTIIGAEILSHLKHVTENMVLGTLEHHERCDGSGYPHGKQNGQISLFGRIIAVADVYDALTAKRVYKEGWSKEKVLQILKEDAENGKFDPKIVSALEELLKEGAL